MTIEELQTIIDSTKWTFCGEGQYNTVLVSTESITIDGYTGKWVLKKQLKANTPINESTRAVRKWNSLNPDYPAFKTKEGWMAPYLGDRPASDEQISNKLIDIYRRTRNIIGDAVVAKGNNFLEYAGEVICVDVDLAFRRGSSTSDWYIGAHDTMYRDFLDACSNYAPKSVSVIKTLFYLEKNLSESEIHDKYLTANLIAKLHDFRYEKKRITVEKLDTLFDLLQENVLKEVGKILKKYLWYLALFGSIVPMVTTTFGAMLLIWLDLSDVDTANATKDHVLDSLYFPTLLGSIFVMAPYMALVLYLLLTTIEYDIDTSWRFDRVKGQSANITLAIASCIASSVVGHLMVYGRSNKHFTLPQIIKFATFGAGFFSTAFGGLCTATGLLKRHYKEIDTHESTESLLPNPH